MAPESSDLTPPSLRAFHSALLASFSYAAVVGRGGGEGLSGSRNQDKFRLPCRDLESGSLRQEVALVFVYGRLAHGFDAEARLCNFVMVIDACSESRLLLQTVDTCNLNVKPSCASTYYFGRGARGGGGSKIKKYNYGIMGPKTLF